MHHDRQVSGNALLQRGNKDTLGRGFLYLITFMSQVIGGHFGGGGGGGGRGEPSLTLIPL